jgi:hypothetical protein
MLPNYFDLTTQSKGQRISASKSRTLLLPANQVRRGGLIINYSSVPLAVWFGNSSIPEDCLAIPPGANIDIPINFIGDIYGEWQDEKGFAHVLYYFKTSR